jgi:FMNH2-dependent dimethyl sulfone monooxygenase
VKFGIWTPLPHTIRHDDAMTAAIADARSTAAVDGPDKAFTIAVETVREAEELGYVTTLVAARHHGPDLDAWVLASALAAQTKSIELIVAVHPGIFNPQMVAKMAASIDRISGGRAAINVVNGWWEQEFENFGNGGWLDASADRYARMAEFMKLLRASWTSDEPFDFSGQFYKASEMHVPLRTAGAIPKIYAASSHPAGQQMIAEFGDTWFKLPFSPDGNLDFASMIEGLRTEVEQIKERANEYDRDLGIGVTAHVIACETDEEAQAKARALVEYGKLDPMNLVVAGAIGSGLVGSYQTVASRLDAYIDAGFDLALLHFYPMREGMRTFMEKVVPLISKKVAVAA